MRGFFFGLVMLVDDKHLEVAFRKAAQVRDEIRTYQLGGERFPTSVDDLFEIVGRMYECEITRRLVPFPSQHLRAFVIRYANGSAEVCVKKEQTPEDRRFSAVKELSHIILDEKEDFQPDGVSTINAYIEEEQVDFIEDQTPPERYIQNELIAFFLALEVLFPREMQEAAYEQLQGGHMDEHKLCARYGLPAWVVFKAMQDDYREASRVIWGRVDQVRNAAAQ